MNLPLFFKVKVNSKLLNYKIIIKNFIISDFIKINNFMYSINLLFLIILLILSINLIDLFPFSFCLNSQLYYLFFLRTIFWLSCIFFSINLYFNKFIFHFTPLGCPMILSPLIVIIEILSLFIRPITLRVRISANLLAGHLILHLLSDFSFFLIKINFSFFFISIILILILSALEIGVSIIQSYIFFTLINIYLSENM